MQFTCVGVLLSIRTSHQHEFPTVADPDVSIGAVVGINLLVLHLSHILLSAHHVTKHNMKPAGEQVSVMATIKGPHREV